MPAEKITEDNCDITITYLGVIKSFSKLVYVAGRPEPYRVQVDRVSEMAPGDYGAEFSSSRTPGISF